MTDRKPEDKESRTKRIREWRGKNREHYNQYQREYKRKYRAAKRKAAGE